MLKEITVVITVYILGYRVIYHSGSTYGYRTLVTLFPQHRLGIFITLTGDDSNTLYRTSITNYIADVMMGEEPWLNASTVCSFPQPWHPPPATMAPPVGRNKTIPSQRPLSAYEGSYRDDGYGEISVVYNKSESQLSGTYGFAEFMLYPTDEKDIFAVETIDILAHYWTLSDFHFQADKTVIYSVAIPDMNPGFPPVFKRAIKTEPNTTSGCSECLSTKSVLIVVLLHSARLLFINIFQM
jgi:hypothetical protein